MLLKRSSLFTHTHTTQGYTKEMNGASKAQLGVKGLFLAYLPPAHPNPVVFWGHKTFRTRIQRPLGEKKLSPALQKGCIYDC